MNQIIAIRLNSYMCNSHIGHSKGGILKGNLIALTSVNYL